MIMIQWSVIEIWHLFMLAITFSNFVTSQSNCSENGVDAVSECTAGFASLHHINTLEGNIGTQFRDKRQSIFPSISFNCNGVLTKWILAAKWEGNNLTNTKLQIWRLRRGGVYDKVGETSIHVDGPSDNEIYEYVVNPPLDFMSGDILGYFQPDNDISQLNLYLENSGLIPSFYLPLGNKDSTSMQTFSLLNSNLLVGNEYPLISIETDPPNCGCGFMNTERINALLSSNSEGTVVRYTRIQYLFPGIKFTCRGEVVKWIVGGTYSSILSRINYPEMQIWRPTGASTYQKLNGTTVIPAAERGSRIYEFIVDPPLPFQPGDILGMFQPPLEYSRLRVDLERRGESGNFYFLVSSSQVEPSHTTINTNNDGWQGGIARPLLSVEIVAAGTSVVTSQVITPTQTTSTFQVNPKTPEFQATQIISTHPKTSEFQATIISSTLQVNPKTSEFQATQINSTLQVNPKTSEFQAVTTEVLPSINTNSPDLDATTSTAMFPILQSVNPTSQNIIELHASITSVQVQVDQDSTVPILTGSTVFVDPMLTSSPAMNTYLKPTPSVPININSAVSSSTNDLMFHVSLGIVATLAVLICVVITLLVAFILRQRKRESKENIIDNTQSDELYTNIANGQNSRNNTEPTTPIQSECEPTLNTECDSRYKVVDTTNPHNDQAPTGSVPHIIAAYAVTSVPPLRDVTSDHQTSYF